MRSERGYTLFEVLVVVGMIGILTAVAIPVFISSNTLNSMWTTSEKVGALVRQTRLKAISQNTTYEVRFSCPAAGQLRALVITGNNGIDTDPNRCSNTQTGDSEIVSMPSGVTYATDLATGLQVTGRGVFTALGDSIPLIIGVTSGGAARYLSVSATGQITFTGTDPHEVEEEDEEP